MNDELKNLIMGASLDDNDTEDTEFLLKESTHEQSENTKEDEDTKEINVDESFIIPDAPIFSIESDIPEPPYTAEQTEKRELLNVEHFSDYKKDEGFSGESILDIDEPEEINVDMVENITILDEEQKSEARDMQSAPEEKKEDPDRVGYNPKKPRKIDTKFEFVELFVFTLLAVVLLTTFVFRHSEVKGQSMEGTLYENDHLIITDLFYSPKCGDIIVFQDPTTGKEEPLVKRVIALEGDTVEVLVDGTVLVNDKPLTEDYILKEPYEKTAMPKVTVPKDTVFVLGDNRNNSSDSRTFYPSKFVREDAILGKVILRFYPDIGKID